MGVVSGDDSLNRLFAIFIPFAVKTCVGFWAGGDLCSGGSRQIFCLCQRITADVKILLIMLYRVGRILAAAPFGVKSLIFGGCKVLAEVIGLALSLIHISGNSGSMVIEPDPAPERP